MEPCPLKINHRHCERGEAISAPFIKDIGLALIFLAMLAIPYLEASDIQVTARLRSKEMNLGETTRLEITINGVATASAPQLPSIDGLEMAHVGQSTELQFANGAMIGGVTFSYEIVPLKEGAFTIPEITVRVGKESFKTNPLTLHVGPSSSVSRQKNLQPQPSAGGNANQTPSSSISSQVGTVQLEYPKRDFYVGELVPVDLKVYLRAGLQISNISLPALSGTAFTIGKLGDQFDQTNEAIDGIPYAVLTWHTAIAAVKTGEHPLGAQIQCIVLIRSRRSSPRDNFLNDPFFEDFFSFSEPKQITLQTPDATVKILPLPTEGQPSDFSGAIGRFQISASASPKEVMVGDPITLKLTFTGTGNFDRVNVPTFGKNPGFKTYTPNAKFEPTDTAGYTGFKTFEQVMIPQGKELKEIPPMRFSFFDPENRKYTSLTTDSIPIKVLEPLPIVQTVPSGPSVIGRSNIMTRPSQAARGTELISNKLELGSTSPSLRPIIFGPWIWFIQLIPLTALATACFIARHRQRLAQDPTFARALLANRVVRAQLEILDLALQIRDTSAFFVAARRILQERLGELLQVKSETITLSEIENRLSDDPSLFNQLRKIFDTADAVSYSGEKYDSQTLEEWKKVVLETLKKLGGKK